MARRRGQSGESGAALGLLLLVVILGLMVFDKNLAILLVAGLVPTIAVAMTEKGTYASYRSQTVGMMNLVGLVPYLFATIKEPRNFESLIFDFRTWLIILGLSSVGYALLYVGPFLAAKFQEVINADKVKSINKQRQALIDSWGIEVSRQEQREEKKFISPKRK